MEFKDVIVIAVFIGLVIGYVYFWYKYSKCQEILHLYVKRCNFLETLYKEKDNEIDKLRELYLKLETKYNKLKEEYDNGNH